MDGRLATFAEYGVVEGGSHRDISAYEYFYIRPCRRLIEASPERKAISNATVIRTSRKPSGWLIALPSLAELHHMHTYIYSTTPILALSPSQSSFIPRNKSMTLSRDNPMPRSQRAQSRIMNVRHGCVILYSIRTYLSIYSNKTRYSMAPFISSISSHPILVITSSHQQPQPNSFVIRTSEKNHPSSLYSDTENKKSQTK